MIIILCSLLCCRLMSTMFKDAFGVDTTSLKLENNIYMVRDPAAEPYAPSAIFAIVDVPSTLWLSTIMPALIESDGCELVIEGGIRISPCADELPTFLDQFGKPLHQLPASAAGHWQGSSDTRRGSSRSGGGRSGGGWNRDRKPNSNFHRKEYDSSGGAGYRAGAGAGPGSGYGGDRRSNGRFGNNFGSKRDHNDDNHRRFDRNADRSGDGGSSGGSGGGSGGDSWGGRRNWRG